VTSVGFKIMTFLQNWNAGWMVSILFPTLFRKVSLNAMADSKWWFQHPPSRNCDEISRNFKGVTPSLLKLRLMINSLYRISGSVQRERERDRERERKRERESYLMFECLCWSPKPHTLLLFFFIWFAKLHTNLLILYWL
jgi:hypothetical protein